MVWAAENRIGDNVPEPLDRTSTGRVNGKEVGRVTESEVPFRNRHRIWARKLHLRRGLTRGAWLPIA
jgi:hypothetical protein